MTQTMTQTVTTLQNDTLDLIALRYFGRTGSITEQIYELNPRLCDLPILLPHGITIVLPTLADVQQQSTEVIQLWS